MPHSIVFMYVIDSRTQLGASVKSASNSTGSVLDTTSDVKATDADASVMLPSSFVMTVAGSTLQGGTPVDALVASMVA